MYAAIRQIKVQPGSIDEVVQLAESGLVPIISNVPGFLDLGVA